ncbi:hypothetical protein KOI35_32475 [Actinoplanes bogorensis]|uniref:Uncharacterized protein n=1 Tax=Paractinoplanes bogorensis TaxID=1610840 RepID=A0ABS5YZV0_9ACTN|nr:hypothetical protein [Actinoplanes bogorensis]MBU2668238.1 hypothetical protein [Actinoplanes bogorensis]
MSDTDETLQALRAEVQHHRGPARTGPLLRLGQALAEAYWRAGPGQRAARPYLDEDIRVLEEAYGYFDPADAWRGQVAALLGQLYAMRHVGHLSAKEDRDRGIELLNEGLAFAQLPPALHLPARMMLGQLHLRRVMARPLGNPGAPADLDRAEQCFRDALAGPSLGAQAEAVVRTMLEMVGVLRAVVSDRGNLRPSGIAEAFRRLRDLQKQAGPGIMLTPWSGDLLARTPPADRPVAVIDVPSARGSFRPSAKQAAGPDVAALRRALRTLLPHPDDPIASARELLHDRVTRSRTDDLVALTAGIAAAEPDDGANHLLLAVALRHRARGGSGGWPEDDFTAAADALNRATTRLGPLDITDELAAILRDQR